jgi:hypothetical protein
MARADIVAANALFVRCAMSLVILNSRKSDVHSIPQLVTIAYGHPQKSIPMQKNYESLFGLTEWRISTHPQPPQANTAETVLVARTPWASIMGKIPAMAIDINTARNPL